MARTTTSCAISVNPAKKKQRAWARSTHVALFPAPGRHEDHVGGPAPIGRQNQRGVCEEPGLLHQQPRHIRPDLHSEASGWLWVKNRVTPKWNLSKWKHSLKPAVPYWFNFDPHPCGVQLGMPCAVQKINPVATRVPALSQASLVEEFPQPLRVSDPPPAGPAPGVDENPILEQKHTELRH